MKAATLIILTRYSAAFFNSALKRKATQQTQRQINYTSNCALARDQQSVRVCGSNWIRLRAQTTTRPPSSVSKASASRPRRTIKMKKLNLVGRLCQRLILCLSVSPSLCFSLGVARKLPLAQIELQAKRLRLFLGSKFH